MRYYVVDKRGRAIAGFFPNDCEFQIEFSRWRRGVRSAFQYATKEKAQEDIEYMRTNCNEKTAAMVAQLRPSLSAAGFQTLPDEDVL